MQNQSRFIALKIRAETLPDRPRCVVHRRLQDLAILDDFTDVERGKSHGARDKERGVSEVLA